MDALPERWEPVNIEAEQGLLGAILVNNEAYRFVSDILQPEYFYEPAHMHIYVCMENLLRMGKLVDPKLLMAVLPDVDVAGLKMRVYLARLAAEGTTIINARDYALVIRDLAKRRELIDLGHRLQEMEPGSALDLAGHAIDEIDAVVSELSNSQTQALSAASMMARTVDAAANAFAADGRIIGLPTGVTKLDRKMLGLTRGDLIVMGGRPGMGKSALMCSIARNMGTAGYNGILFSQEMSEISLGQRLVTDHLFNNGPMTYFNLRAGRFSEEQFNRITGAAEELGQLPLRIEPKPFQSASEISQRVRQAKRSKGLDFWFVDHLNIMNHPGKGMTRNDQIGATTAQLKALAKETDTVGIVLCQLSRAVEQRENKRPTLADLRDSGNIEQDADAVWMLYRDSYYLERREPAAGTPEHAAWQTAIFRAENRLEIAVEKQRAGPTGTIDVFCNIACNAVRDLDEREVAATAALPDAVASSPDDDPRFL